MTNRDPFHRDRVNDALEVLHAHAEWLYNEGHVGHGVKLSEARQLLQRLGNVNDEEKPGGLHERPPRD